MMPYTINAVCVAVACCITAPICGYLLFGWPPEKTLDVAAYQVIAVGIYWMFNRSDWKKSKKAT